MRNGFSEVAEYKIIHRNILHFYTLINFQKDKLIIPLITASKRIRHLGINLTKEVNYLYSEKYKALMEKTEYDTVG